MGYMYFRILCLRNSDLAISLEKFKLATKTLGKYPIALFVFWLPHMLSVFVLRTVLEKYHVAEYYVASLVVKICHGIATTMIFFFDSKEARYHWAALFKSFYVRLFGETEVDTSRDSVSSVDPSRWGDKTLSLTYDLNELEPKQPVFLSSTMSPRFSQGAPDDQF
jgi:hypothetical protein